MLTFLKKKRRVLSPCKIALLKMDELYPSLFSQSQSNRISIKLITVHGKNVEEMIDYVRIFNSCVLQQTRLSSAAVNTYPENTVTVGRFFRNKKGELINSAKHAEMLLYEIRKALLFFYKLEGLNTRSQFEDFYYQHMSGTKMMFITLVEELNDTFQR